MVDFSRSARRLRTQIMKVDSSRLRGEWIDPYALKIVDLLQKKGFETYLVGGCVRDLLAGIRPKDFDIATSARPEQVRRAVPHCYIIGRRFRLVLAKRGLDQFEIATFRRNGTEEEVVLETNIPNDLGTDSQSSESLAETQIEESDRESSKPNFEDNGSSIGDSNSPNILKDNFFGTSEEDARRRDFTVNGLFFDPGARKIIDHVGGLLDVENRMIRMIGDPVTRLIEDPIRTLRAVRLSHKLSFQIDPKLREAILKTRLELKKSVLPRRREEYLKLLRLKHPERAYLELFDLGVLEAIAPRLHDFFLIPDATDIFFKCLSRIHVGEIDLTSSVELFAAFIYSFVKSRHEITGEATMTLLEDSITTELMKTDLGIFKMESAIILRTIQLLEQLSKKDTYLRKGQRRQKAMLLNESMPLAIKMGQLDYSLVGSNLIFWLSEQERHQIN